MVTVLEFYNKVHSKSDGKFAETPGPGHAKGAPKPTAAQKAALAKVLSKPKTSAGSVVVPSKTAAVKGTPEKKAPAAVKKAAPAAIKKAAPEAKGGADSFPATTTSASALVKHLHSLGYKDITEASVDAKGRWVVGGREYNHVIKPGADIHTALKLEVRAGAGKQDIQSRMQRVRLGDQEAKGYDAYGGKHEHLGDGSPPAPPGLKQHEKISDDGLAGLMAYRSGAHDDINKALRGVKQTYDPYIDKAQVKQAIAGIDDAFKHAPRTTKDIVVYRDFTEGGIPGGGKAFQDKAFISTTWDNVNQAGVGKTSGTIKIVIPKGSRPILVSGYESELLLPRGGTFTPQSDGSYLYSE